MPNRSAPGNAAFIFIRKCAVIQKVDVKVGTQEVGSVTVAGGNAENRIIPGGTGAAVIGFGILTGTVSPHNKLRGFGDTAQLNGISVVVSHFRSRINADIHTVPEQTGVERNRVEKFSCTFTQIGQIGIFERGIITGIGFVINIAVTDFGTEERAVVILASGVAAGNRSEIGL